MDKPLSACDGPGMFIKSSSEGIRQKSSSSCNPVQLWFCSAWRFRPVLLAAVMALLAGCSSPTDKQPAASVFRYSNIDEPRRLDPAFVKDYYEGVVAGWVYEGLTRFGKGTDVEPALAGKWEVSDDGRTYVFHLREAKFSTGAPVRAADVRYSFTRVLRPETGSDRKWVLNRIEGADEVVSGTTKELRGLETPDERTVRITLKSPYPVFPTLLAMPNAAIVPEGSAGTTTMSTPLDRAPVGSGPWVFDKWMQGQRLEFHRNDAHWGGAPKIERLIYHVQVDDNVRRREFEIGNLDYYEVSFAVFPAWSHDAEKAKRMLPLQELRSDFLAFNNASPKFADRRVREAVAHGINTRSIFENLQLGRGKLAHGPVPPGIAGYRENVKPREYDPERARALLAESGALGMEISLWYRDEALWSEIVKAAKSDLEKVGLKVSLVPRDLASLRAGVWDGKPDMYLGSWTLDYPDMENAMVPPFHSRNIPRQGNGSRFRNEDVDKLLDAAQSEKDPAARIAKFQTAEDKIIAECPWVFLFHRRTDIMVSPRTKGFEPAAMYNANRFDDVEVRQTPAN
ncbi:MAG: ABC transporter substrate-binding protein [Candidatus Sumerlaeaceae bacterium]|nr:ABC transporter substrate-binding protein [Candidatus Sumerlaeaceae bacterium]